jgi:hypothetical protein
VSWYMAVIVRGSFVDGELDEARLGDSLFKLVEAPNVESAYQRAIQLGEASADDYTDDDGQTIRLQFLGLGDLREVTAAAIGDGTEVYSELIPTKPSRRVVEKEHLTVFEPDEPSEGLEAYDAEPEDPGRFTDGSPIR